MGVVHGEPVHGEPVWIATVYPKSGSIATHWRGWAGPTARTCQTWSKGCGAAAGIAEGVPSWMEERIRNEARVNRLQH